jgi:imidazolonepropionase-like amidohydrolase
MRAADAIKFWDDDRNHTKPKMPADMFRAIIDEARAHKIPVIAHTFYLEDARAVAEAGISGLAHPVRDQPIDQTFIDAMKRNHAFQCSNLSGMAPRDWLDSPVLHETVSASAIESFKSQPSPTNPSIYATSERNEKIESDAGIRIVLCGDTGGVLGQFPGFTEHRELQSLVDAGISPLQVIHDATEVSAETLGLLDLGQLVSGKSADFIVLNANPLDNIANTLQIAAIYKKGQPIDRDSLRARIASERGR